MNLTGIPPAQKPPKPIRDKAHLKYVASNCCAICKGSPPIQAAHIRIGWYRMQEKPGDDKTVPLCQVCHTMQHSMNETEFWEKMHHDPFELAAFLWHERTGQWPIWWSEGNED